MASIKQMVNRLHSGHLVWLKAYAEGSKVTTQRASDARGLMTSRQTLIEWGAIDGDRITAIGQVLLMSERAGFRCVNR